MLSNKTLSAQKDSSVLNVSASYSADFAYNFVGGLKTGFAYMGIADIAVSFNTSDLKLWNGGEFLVHGATTHGNTFSADYLGDMQVASNIEAGNIIYLHELWYAQQMGILRITAGLQDLNATCMATELGTLYLNSSFGIPASLSSEVPLPIFPLTGLGLLVEAEITDFLKISSSIYDGYYEAQTENPHNTKWAFNKKDGYLLNAELAYTYTIFNTVGTSKIGLNHHSHFKTEQEPGTLQSVATTNAIYFITDQMLTTESTTMQAALFVQMSGFAGNALSNWMYAGAGINLSHFSKSNPENTIGIALAHAAIDSDAGNETAIEITYKAYILSNFYLQPDIQYILNPAGTDRKLENALAGILRCTIEL